MQPPVAEFRRWHGIAVSLSMRSGCRSPSESIRTNFPSIAINFVRKSSRFFATAMPRSLCPARFECNAWCKRCEFCTTDWNPSKRRKIRCHYRLTPVDRKQIGVFGRMSTSHYAIRQTCIRLPDGQPADNIHSGPELIAESRKPTAIHA